MFDMFLKSFHKTIVLCVIVVAAALVLSACKNKRHSQPLENTMQHQNQSTRNITVFVHGTHFALLTKLFQKTLFIERTLVPADSLHKDSYVKWFIEKVSASDPAQFPKEHFYAIGWSGKLSNTERMKAAQNIYNHLQKLVDELRAHNIEPKITIISHSHGGNVALNLATIQPNHTFKINRLVLLATPVQEQTKHLIEHEIFENVYSLYSRADLVQIIDPQGLQGAKENLFSERRFKACAKLKQGKVKINKRALLHIEFVFGRFPALLPQVLNAMNQLAGDDTEQLIKVAYKDKKIQGIEIK